MSGASVAGPVVAYWLARRGHAVTVVERASVFRRAGGHAVDLFRPAMDIMDRMGVAKQVEALATGTDYVMLTREGAARAVHIDLTKALPAVSDRHVEIMRDDLSETLYAATAGDVEYVFGDSITSISSDGDVSFEHGEPRRFDVVVGADGLHSNVRRLVFGEESDYSRFLGAYLAVASLPKALSVDRRMLVHAGAGRTAALYSAQHLADARALFLFRANMPLEYDHRDTGRQKELLRAALAGLAPEADAWLGELDTTPAFYFDSITQLTMDTWSRGRVTLVGDAGFCPGPVVGGSTSLAVVSAYTLAEELARADGDHVRAFAAYERAIGEYVRASRAFALRAARTVVPATGLQVWAVVTGVRLVSRMPPPLARAFTALGLRGVRVHESVVLPDYPAAG
ncbi:FAD-dependent monooxygenase [Sinomonas sp. ASV322]|uniref:FAD-dependent monooxygenase n=1 Tax=Sinomonas sp. ASV322 TaxID=3041920 RepID=UPI0027DB4947|nr:FAD-dependent monooxygenase [Sinomonas sp. ASV322]MDQ4502584.1 FAD-dependent monooxygenase [Sinomonas sp. ASV322]